MRGINKTGEVIHLAYEKGEKRRLAKYAEDFFRCMDEQKRCQIEIRINLSITVMRKLYHTIKSYMKKTAVKFIVCSDNPNGTHIFISKSFRKARNKWIHLRRDCDWYSIFAINHDGAKWKVHWCYHDRNREKIIKFFDKDGEKICELLTELTEWWRQT